MATERRVIRKTSGDRAHDLHTTSVFYDDHLPDELLFRIFVHLPTKAIYRCRCVSKHWLSLLSDSNMASWFFFYPIQRPLSILLFDQESRKKLREVHHIDDSESNLDHKVSFDFILQPNKSLVAVAWYDDLILFRRSDCLQDSLYLCNMFTKQWNQIEFPCWLHENVIGLLPDRVVGVYAERSRTGRCSLKALVFEFSKRKWRRKCTGLRISLVNSTSWKGLACNGKLYWLSNLQKCGVVLVYDPSKYSGDIGLVSYPVHKNDNIDYKTFWSIGECKGKLRMSKLSSHKVSPFMPFLDELVLWIWELEYNQSPRAHNDRKTNNNWYSNWCLKFKESLLDFVFEDDRISLGKKHKYDHPGENRVLVRGFHPYNGDILYLEFQNKFLLCNLQQRTLIKIHSNGQ